MDHATAVPPPGGEDDNPYGGGADTSPYRDTHGMAPTPPPAGGGGGGGAGPAGFGRHKSFADLGNEIARKIGGYVSVIFVASVAVMVSSSVECNAAVECGGLVAYGVAVGAVSLAAALLFILVQKGGNASEGTVRMFAHFFVLWWLPGVAILTFSGPPAFFFTGNGYFACWAAFLSSCAFLHQEVEAFRGRWAQFKGAFAGREASRRGLLLAASLVVMWEASAVCAKQATPEGTNCADEFGWAVACGTISFIVMLAYHIPSTTGFLQPHNKLVAYALLVWWVFGVGVLTFKGPFKTTGNGFFGAWVAGYAAFAMAADEFQGLNDGSYEDHSYDTMGGGGGMGDQEGPGLGGGGGDDVSQI